MKIVTLAIRVNEAVYHKDLPVCTEDRVRSVIMMALDSAKKEGVFYVDGDCIIPYQFTRIDYVIKEVE